MDEDIAEHNIALLARHCRLAIRSWLDAHKEHLISPGPEENHFTIAQCSCGRKLEYKFELING